MFSDSSFYSFDFGKIDISKEKALLHDIASSSTYSIKQCTCWSFVYIPEIKKVIFNDGHTIAFWHDGTKTVVNCQDGDEFDPEKGLAMAICKKAFGNTGSYYNRLKTWLPEEKEIDDKN